MATNIEIVAESLKHETGEYKMLYDGLVSAKERELKELRDNYKQAQSCWQRRKSRQKKVSILPRQG